MSLSNTTEEGTSEGSDQIGASTDLTPHARQSDGEHRHNESKNWQKIKLSPLFTHRNKTADQNEKGGEQRNQALTAARCRKIPTGETTTNRSNTEWWRSEPETAIT